MEIQLERAKSLILEKRYSEANEILGDLTYKGNNQAAQLLAENNFYGRGVDEDRETAYVILTSAIERTQNIKLIECLCTLRSIDHSRVSAQLNDKEKKEFFEETFNYFMFATFNNSQNPLIYFILGMLYESGTGTEISLASAQESYKRSIEICYQNREQYFDLLIQATFRLARLQLNFEQTLQDGVNNILNCAQYLAIAQLFAGRFYYEGKLKEKDYSKAFDYFNKAAKKGLLEAQFYLAELYENGIPNVCDKDLNKAIELYFSVAVSLSSRGKSILECLPSVATSPEYCIPIEQRSIEKLKIHRPQLLNILDRYTKLCSDEKCTFDFTGNQFALQHMYSLYNYPGFNYNHCICSRCMQKCYDGYQLMDNGISTSFCDCRCSKCNNK